MPTLLRQIISSLEFTVGTGLTLVRHKNSKKNIKFYKNDWGVG